jgi:hypothetical protein
MSERVSGIAPSRLLRRTRASAPRVPVSLGHEEDLEALVDVLRSTVQLEAQCDYAEPPNGRQRNRRAFVAHFGGSGELFEAWDAAVLRTRTAPAALWGWFARAANDRGIVEPPFAVGALIDRLATWTLERARRGQLDTPHGLYLQHFKDRVEGREHMSIYVEGQKIAKLPCEERADVIERLEAADGLIQSLFDDAQTCVEACEIEHARDSLLELKQQLLDHLAKAAATSPIVVARGCPVCQRKLEQPRES